MNTKAPRHTVNHSVRDSHRLLISPSMATRTTTPISPSTRTTNNTRSPTAMQTANVHAGDHATSNTWSDAGLMFAFVAAPVMFVCLAQALFRWLMKTGKNTSSRSSVILRPSAQSRDAALTQPDPSTPVPPLPAFSSPQARGKTVTWQSPFDTPGRQSRPSYAFQRGMTASDLNFVIVETPAKTKVFPPGVTSLCCEAKKNQLPTSALHQLEAKSPVTTFRLDILDSPPSSDANVVASTVAAPVTSSANNMPTVDSTSISSDLVLPSRPEPENTIVARDSPRVSVSSLASEDPETTQKLDEAMRWTQATQTIRVSVEVDPVIPHQLLRASSSLDDFRHDLHHQPATNAVVVTNDDPEQITRSSEYSF